MTTCNFYQTAYQLLGKKACYDVYKQLSRDLSLYLIKSLLDTK